MTEILFNPEISPCLWGTPAGAPTPLSCQSQAPAAPHWILCMQRGVGGDQGVTKAGGQVTNLSVPFRGGLEQWGVHGGKNHLSRSLSNPAKPCIVLQVFNGKRLSPTVLGSGGAVGHPEPLFLHVMRPRMQFRYWKSTMQTQRAQCHRLLLPEIKNFFLFLPKPPNASPPPPKPHRAKPPTFPNVCI